MYLFTILLFILSPLVIILLIALEEFVWYRRWSRKRQFKKIKKHYDKNK